MAKKSYDVKVFSKLCKACGICVSLCLGRPENVFVQAPDGKAVVAKPENCTGCRNCELHCPDFCVEVYEKDGDNNSAEVEGK